MHTANLELSRELYELSGWSSEEDSDYYWYRENTDIEFQLIHQEYAAFYHSDEYYPAYDLGFLLRKLQGLSDKPDEPSIRLDFGDRKPRYEWLARCYVNINKDGSAYADTPENAVAKLAISLFKQGILTREAL